MKFIGKVVEIIPEKPNGRTILYMHGYGGHVWQAKRHLDLLKNQGYRIIALDFSYRLSSYNPQDLLDLMDEVDNLMKAEKLLNKNTIIVGISLGGLAGLNMVRRHSELNKLLCITGGDISRLPSKESLAKKWQLTRDEIGEKWSSVNMYTKAGLIKDKHIIMMLPVRDKVIDPDEVRDEIALQQKYNEIVLVHTRGGHFRTIITETVLFPRRSLKLIKQLEKY
jgi:pimeloyl-ACP methyl ester carboxylesterase